MFKCGYEIIKEAGKGVYGTVYVVNDNGIKKALKIQHKSAEGITNIIEMDILTRIRHPHIVKGKIVHDQHDEIGILMPYYETNLMDATYNKILTCSQKLRIFKQIFSACNFLYETCHILHLDIKGSNILLDDHFNAYLCDFSLATKLDHMNQNVKIYNKEIISECFRPYELFCDVPHIIGEHSVIWQLGMLLIFIFGECHLPITVSTGKKYLYRKFAENNITKLNSIRNFLIDTMVNQELLETLILLCGEMIEFNIYDRIKFSKLKTHALLFSEEKNHEIKKKNECIVKSISNTNVIIYKESVVFLIEEVKTHDDIPVDCFFLTIDLIYRTFHLFGKQYYKYHVLLCYMIACKFFYYRTQYGNEDISTVNKKHEVQVVSYLKGKIYRSKLTIQNYKNIIFDLEKYVNTTQNLHVDDISFHEFLKLGLHS